MAKEIKVIQDSVYVRLEDGTPTAIVVRNDQLRHAQVFLLSPASDADIAALMGPIEHV